MKQKLSFLLLALTAAGGFWLAVPASAPAQGADEDAGLVALVAEITKQQATLQENQAKIDEQIAAVAEDVRQSRLFAARGGNKR